MPFNNEDEIQIEREKWNLSEKEYNESFNNIFNELVLTGNATHSQNPTFIMVGGQAGSGKSMLVGKELRNLASGAIIIDQDLLRTKHPKYQKIHDMYTEREEFLLLKRYLDQLINDIIAKSLNEGYNLILESALRSVSKFIKNTVDVKERGYSTKLSILAVSPDEANLSMFTRFCQFLERYGECRRNTRVDNDSVNKISLNIDKMHSLEIFDNITVSVRGNELNDYLPIETYSQRETPNIPVAQIYINIVAGEDKKIDSKNFAKRYFELRAILEKYNQKIQLDRLDEFYAQFILKREKPNQYPSFYE